MHNNIQRGPTTQVVPNRVVDRLLHYTDITLHVASDLKKRRFCLARPHIPALTNVVGVIFSVARTDISRTTVLSSVCAVLSAILVLPSAIVTADG